ncbi:HlyD family secretion protein [Azospirillum baldaniorum]|uniref:HlyD family secretion protein n=1 Tax=Azospirillum baldaniorum TaxID=1064539 RepID=UPI001649027B|nr:HlyD family efflux transporter periplasmic adaptor subunit [Azospirillum baldaniorum]
MAEHQTQWLGTVLMVPRLSHSAVTAFALLAAAGVLALLFGADYTRKARIAGWLVPKQGLARVVTPRAGVVTQLFVQEGTTVRKGQPLLALSNELRSEARGATQGEIIQRLASRRDSLRQERDLQQRLFRQRMTDRASRIAALQIEQEHLEREIELQRGRLRLAEESTARQRKLRERDIATAQRLEEAEEAQFVQALRLQTLQRARANAERERLTLVGELEELPLRSPMQLAEIDRAITAVEQEIAEAEARRQIIITAPQNGTVTALQVEPGGSANPATPLLSVIPQGSPLEAQLFSPSRAVGFVRPGQTVRLRYQPFPYQKFGFYEGVVTSVSGAALNPAELPQQHAGLTSLYSTGEPVYRITVSLARQAVTVYGHPVPLQPGMQLDADVLLETRRLIEWVLDPLYTLTGKLDADVPLESRRMIGEALRQGTLLVDDGLRYASACLVRLLDWLAVPAEDGRE